MHYAHLSGTLLYWRRISLPAKHISSSCYHLEKAYITCQHFQSQNGLSRLNQAEVLDFITNLVLEDYRKSHTFQLIVGKLVQVG